MSKLIVGILVLMLFVISGYVASSPAEDAQSIRAANTGPHPDPHVNYYLEHLTAMGIEQRQP